jgi:hypothetical protein
VVAFAACIADLHVVDVGGFDSDSAAQGIKHLGEQLLGVQVVQGAGRLAFAARRANPVDDQRFTHQQAFPGSGWS